MSAPGKPVADPSLRARKLRDASVLLPLLGTVLLLPPMARVVALDARLFGVPLSVAYIFVVWAALIVAARALARRLSGDVGPSGPGV